MADEWNAQAGLDVRRYGRILWRRKWLVAGITMAFGLAGAAVARDTSVSSYLSSAEVLVKPITANPLQGPARVDQAVDLETEGRILGSTAVAQLATAKLASTESPEALAERVGAAVSPDTQILRVSFRAATPDAARAGAQAFADSYLDYKTNEALTALRGVTDRIQKNVTDLDAQLSAANAAMVANLPDTAPYTQAQGTRDVLTSQIAQLRNQIATYTAVAVEPGAVIRPAETAVPQRARHLPVPLVGALGLLLGLAIALVRDRFDDRLQSASDVQQLVDLPLLAAIPRRRWSRRGERIADPRTPDAEAYQRLAANLVALNRTGNAKRVLITSASAGEGKSTVAANVAAALARTHHVALVSADFRLPTLGEFFDTGGAASINDLLAGRATASDVAASPLPNLDVYASSRTSGHPAKELQSPAMGAFLEHLGTTHDIVIVDAPPILPVADTLALAAAADATILVIRQGNTRQGAVGQTREQLDQVGTRLVGVVVTHAGRAKVRHGYYEAPAPRVVAHRPLLRRAMVEAMAERDMAGVSYWPRP